MPARARSGTRTGAAAAIAAGAVLVAGLVGAAAPRAVHHAPRPARKASGVSLARVPLGFEPNRGQAASGTRFLAHAEGGVVSLGRRGVGVGVRGHVARVEFAGAHAAAPVAIRRVSGHVNYMVGRDRSRWHIGVPTYARVVYRHVWPGIDAGFHGAGRRLEYDFSVRPGAEPRRISLRAPGARLDAAGALVVGPVRELAPRAFQLVDGRRRAVASGYVARGHHRFGIAVGRYDRSRPLVVDPVLTYSTYLGGSGLDWADGIAVGEDGSVYVTGYTDSSGAAPNGFPTKPAPPYQGVNRGGDDAFVTRLNPAGNALVYSTYFGGTSGDVGNAIAVDPAGNAFFTGQTESTGMGSIPTQLPYQTTNAGAIDAFVAELDPTGTQLLYSTYFGGTGNDIANGIAVDSMDRPHIVGDTASSDLPHTTGTPSYVGNGDAFLAILTPGTTLPLSRYLGGTGGDDGNAIAVDSAGNSYLTGGTNSLSTDIHPFPLKDPYQSTNTVHDDAFVTKIDPVGDLVYSTYLGGDGNENGRGIALDASNRAFVGGYSTSSDFPTVNPIDGTGDPQQDAFVSEFAPSGQSLVGSTLLGGGAADAVESVATAPDGSAWVSGLTLSSGSSPFPTAAPVQGSYGGGDSDAFVAHLSAGLASLPFSTYLGGGASDYAFGVAVDGAGAAYVVGSTNSTGASPFPTAGAFQSGFAGGKYDAFVAKLAEPAAGSGGGGGGGNGNGGGGGNGNGGGTPTAPKCVVLKLAAKKKRRRVTATVDCDAAAAVRLTLTSRVPHRKKPLALGRATGNVPAGPARALTLRLTRGNFTQLRKRRKLKVTVTLHAAAGGLTRTAVKTLTLRAPH